MWPSLIFLSLLFRKTFREGLAKKFGKIHTYTFILSYYNNSSELSIWHPIWNNLFPMLHTHTKISYYIDLLFLAVYEVLRFLKNQKTMMPMSLMRGMFIHPLIKIMCLYLKSFIFLFFNFSYLTYYLFIFFILKNCASMGGFFLIDSYEIIFILFSIFYKIQNYTILSNLKLYNFITFGANRQMWLYFIHASKYFLGILFYSYVQRTCKFLVSLQFKNAIIIMSKRAIGISVSIAPIKRVTSLFHHSIKSTS